MNFPIANAHVWRCFNRSTQRTVRRGSRVAVNVFEFGRRDFGACSGG